MPNPQERPSLHDIVDHAFFTSGIVPGFIPISAWEMPPDFRHISPLVSQANLSRLRQACQLDVGTPLRHLRPSRSPCRAQVAPAASHSKSTNSRRQYNPAVRSPRCSVLRGSCSWSHRAVSSAPLAANQHSYANCRPQRRKLP